MSELLSSMDKGPWSVFRESIKGGRALGVISDDFTHDVVLKVCGDFEDIAQRENYCRLLADKLNS